MGPDVLAVGPAVEGEPDRRRSAVRRTGDGLEVQPYTCPDGMRRAGLWGRIRGQLRPHDGSGLRFCSRVYSGWRRSSSWTRFCSWSSNTRGGSQQRRRRLPCCRPWGQLHRPSNTPGIRVHHHRHVGCHHLPGGFTAGTVEHLLSGRYVGLVGRRVMPRSGHVVVVGLGQVGFRLCQELRAQGLAVIALERSTDCPNLPLARAADIPVLLGTAAHGAL